MNGRLLPAAVLLIATLAACNGATDVPAPDVGRLEPAAADRVLAAHAAVVTAGDTAAWQHYGATLLLEGLTPEAADALEHAAGLPEADRAGCLHAAGVSAAVRDQVRGLALLRAAQEAGADSPSTHLRLANLLEQAGALDEAEAHYREAENGAPRSFVLLGLGRVALARGDTQGAITYLDQARVADDRHVEVLIVLARAYRVAGDERRAEQFAQAVPPHHQTTPLPDAYLRDFLQRQVLR
jgi:tetratricopeptide (TPR) repeat protein